MASRKKLLLALLLAVLAAAFLVFDLGRFLSLEQLKAHQAGLAELQAQRPLLVAGVYFAVYVVVAALSVPGAAVLTLAGGALFGLVGGTVLASFASSVGATLAFLVSRHLLRDAVQRRFGQRLAAIDRGVEREGAFYLFTLRLVPLVPFFLINLAMGLTRMRTGVFYAVSQIGMLAGTVVYVNAGTQMAKLESASGLLSPGLVGAFVLLGVFPLAARRLAEAARARRVYARWRHLQPKAYDRNLVVIGAGSAGLVSAFIGAAVKAKVTLVEAHRMGGDCLNTGCVPSKALIRTATLLHQMRQAGAHGIDGVQPRVDFARVMQRVAEAVRQVEPHDSVERYTGLGVDVVQGHARIVDPWRVEITRADGSRQTLTTRSIVIATGAAPVLPPLPGLREAGVLTSETLWGLRELPRRLVVLGGGPIGCEMAQCFARLGSQVVLVEMGERLLAREDPEVSQWVREALERDGVEVRTGHRALRCEPQGQDASAGGKESEGEGDEERAGRTGHVLVVQALAGGSPPVALAFDRLLCAVGRAARLEGFGLEALGIPSGLTLDTNERLQTIYPNILAAGDVAGPFQLTHAASHQAWTATVNALFGGIKTFKVDHAVLPWAVFTDPEVARVGLNEQDARAQGVPFEVTRYGLDDLDRAIADGTAHGFVKVLTVPGKDRILGAAIVGPHAAELLAEIVLAMKHGLGLNKILGTVHTYPTLSEANKQVAGAWRRAHAPQRALRLLERLHAWRRG